MAEAEVDRDYGDEGFDTDTSSQDGHGSGNAPGVVRGQTHSQLQVCTAPGVVPLELAAANAAKTVPPPRQLVPPRAASAPPLRKRQAAAAAPPPYMVRSAAAPSSEAQMTSVLRLSRPRTAQCAPPQQSRARPATAPSQRRPRPSSFLASRVAPQASQARVQEIVDTCVKRVLAHAVLPPPPAVPRARPASAGSTGEGHGRSERSGASAPARRRAPAHGGRRPKSTGRVPTADILRRLYEPLRQEQEARRSRQEREATEAVRMARKTGVVRPPPRQEQKPRKTSLRQPLRPVNAMQGPQGKKLAAGAGGVRFGQERLFATNDGWPSRWPVDILHLPCTWHPPATAAWLRMPGGAPSHIRSCSVCFYPPLSALPSQTAATTARERSPRGGAA